MSDRKFESEEEQVAYAAGMEDAAKKFQRPRLTLADVQQMSTREIMDRKAEVDEVLRGGARAGGDTDDD